MPRIKFTAKSIQSLKPEIKSKEYFDQGRKSAGAFGIRISPKDKRTWFIMYKNDLGKVKRYTLGDYPTLSLKDARAAANSTMTDVSSGNDPMAEKVAKRTAPTMNNLWDAYLEGLALRKKPKAASTIYAEQRMWDRNLKPVIGNMKVENITPPILADILDDKAKTAPVQANRLHSLLNILFKPAMKKGWLTVHPMQWLDKPGGTEPPRTRHLSDDEIRTLWPFFEQLQSIPCDLFKLGLLTAQRPGELRSMRWDDLNLDTCIWTQKNTKTGNTHLVPLSKQVLDILKSRPRINKWVFPASYARGKKEAGHTVCTNSARIKLQEISGVSDWTAHDLRRTARTLMSRLNIKHHIRERVLNHSQGKIQATYDQHDYLQEKSDAMDKLSREIYRILGKETGAQIVPLRAQA